MSKATLLEIICLDLNDFKNIPMSSLHCRNYSLFFGNGVHYFYVECMIVSTQKAMYSFCCRSFLLYANAIFINKLSRQHARIQRGEGCPDLPPGKSLVIWVFIGNEQMDLPLSWRKLDPTGQCWAPLWKIIVFFEICKIS